MPRLVCYATLSEEVGEEEATAVFSHQLWAGNDRVAHKKRVHPSPDRLTEKVMIIASIDVN